MLVKYLNQMIINLEDMKEYIYRIDPDHYSMKLENCFTKKQFLEKVYAKKNHYLNLAIGHLYSDKGIDLMENNLIMMNYFFENEIEYKKVKVILYKIIMKLDNPYQQYQLLRHIIPVNNQTLIEELVKEGYVNYEQASYIYLVEENISYAYYYLSALDYPPHYAIMDLYGSYDLVGYVKLLRHFEKDHNYGTKDILPAQSYHTSASY